MLLFFLVGSIHFIELPLGSHTAVLNMSPKNASLYLRSQHHTARTCWCVSIGCRYLCGEKSKVSEVGFCEFLPPLHQWALLPCPVPCPWAGCITQQSTLHTREGDPPSVPICALSHLHLVLQFIAFQGHPKLRATAPILPCYKHLREAMKMNICNMIMRLNLCWIPSP